MKKIFTVLLMSLFLLTFLSCGSDDDMEEGKGGEDVNGEEESDDQGDGPVCGNNIIEEGEVCDGNAKACGDLDSSYIGGIAVCLEDCSGYDFSDCREEEDPHNPTSNVLCWDTYLCVVSCKEDQECENECLSNASDEAKNLYNIMMNCVNTHCSGASDFPQCVQDNCAEERDSCLQHFEPAAPGTCMAIIECQQQCPQGDQGCLQSCVNQGNEQGQKLYNDYLDCVNGCGGDQTCVDQQCTQQAQACANDK